MDFKESDFDQNNLKIEKELGSGSYGKVYSGYLKSNGLKIAIKRVNKQKIRAVGEYLLEALKKELECMAKCECENSVKLYTNMETENNYNIVMELCDNDLSKELQKRPNGLSVEEVRYIMSQFNYAFKKMQENHIIHRDLKLGNILIKYTDETQTKFIPKLCDYGFSKQLDRETSTQLGTPATMAPEVLKNQKYDERADLWSIGVLMYELHFKSLPFKGKNPQEIYLKIKNKQPYKQPVDPDLRDLINRLLIEDRDKRITWKEYFNHPFFKGTSNKEEDKEEKENVEPVYIGKGTRYIYERDFDIGFKSDLYKCCIALDTKHKKKVLIKIYDGGFINSHKSNFTKEYNLQRIFGGNDCFLKLINVEMGKNSLLVYDYVESEILSSYITHQKFDEKKLQILSKELFEKIFSYSEVNIKPFIFISVYSFAITNEGKPILFDFGLNRFLLPIEEVKQYYIPNEAEIVESLFPLKTNVMNYGITLLKCFYGNNFKIKISDNEIILPENSDMSEDFKKFLSKCLKKNIDKRNSWLELNTDKFIQSLSDGDNAPLNGDLYKGKTLISDKKLKGIFKSLDNKYDLINKYYDSIEVNEDTPYLQQIEYFLILILFEQLAIVHILNKNKDNKNHDPKKELSFIYINKKDANEFKINFGNPLLKNIKIFNNQELINDFLIKLQKHITKLKEISLKFHKITKSEFFKGDYQNFLKEFSYVIVDEEFKNYFLSLTKEANNDWLEKNYEKVKIKAPIAEYLSESVILIIICIMNVEKEKIYYKLDEYLEKFDEIFENEDENNIQVSSIKLSKGKQRYILVSFNGLLLKYLINLLPMNQIDFKKNKASLEKLLEIYHKLMETLVETQ